MGQCSSGCASCVTPCNPELPSPSQVVAICSEILYLTKNRFLESDCGVGENKVMYDPITNNIAYTTFPFTYGDLNKTTVKPDPYSFDITLDPITNTTLSLPSLTNTTCKWDPTSTISSYNTGGFVW